MLAESASWSDANDKGFDASKNKIVGNLQMWIPASFADLAIVATNNLNDTPITIQTIGDTEYTFTFSNVTGRELVLFDKEEGISTIINTTNSYVVSLPQNTTVEGRFFISPSFDVYIRENLHAGDYGTLCLPRTVSAAAKAVAGADFYTLAGADDTYMYFDAVDADAELEAGRPYMFKVQEGYTTLTCELSGALVSAPDNTNSNGLYGSFVIKPQGSIAGKYIVLASSIKLCDATYGGIKSNRCYIDLDEAKAAYTPSSSPKRIRMTYSETTAVENVAAENVTKALINGQVVIIREGVMYNMNGQVIK